MDIKLHTAFKKLITSAIKLNKELRANIGNTQNLSRYYYVQEFCTIKLDIGRQIGKTSYILEQVKSNKNSILFVNSKQQAFIYKEVSDRCFILPTNTFDNILHGKDLSEIKTVYVDDAHWSSNINIIYEIFSQDDIERTFILLG